MSNDKKMNITLSILYLYEFYHFVIIFYILIIFIIISIFIQFHYIHVYVCVCISFYLFILYLLSMYTRVLFENLLLHFILNKLYDSTRYLADRLDPNHNEACLERQRVSCFVAQSIDVSSAI